MIAVTSKEHLQPVPTDSSARSLRESVIVAMSFESYSVVQYVLQVSYKVQVTSIVPLNGVPLLRYHLSNSTRTYCAFTVRYCTAAVNY
jgi:hypothetical protein